MTTYDELWTFFLNNCKTSDINLPSKEEVIKERIRSAIMYMNNRFREDIIYDHDLEIISNKGEPLSNDFMLIAMSYLRLIFLKNELSTYATTYQPFQKDIGVRNFATQLRILESAVLKEEDDIRELVKYMGEDY